MSARIGDWIQVYTGRPFWPLDPRPEEIDIEDIAQALSLKCRYGGHCRRFYSVAEHSVLVSHHVAPEHALWALLHDAGEAYLADVPRPVKPSLQGWKQLEAGLMRVVCARFGLPSEEPDDVKRADFAITTDEKAALMADGPAWAGLLPPLGVKIECLSPMDARAAFMSRFKELHHG